MEDIDVQIEYWTRRAEDMKQESGISAVEFFHPLQMLYNLQMEKIRRILAEKTKLEKVIKETNI